MNNITEILHPVRNVTVNGSPVEVRELQWGSAREFVKMLSGHAGQLLRTGDKGAITFSFESLPQLIAATDELSSYLICKATGKDAAWLESLPTSKALELLETALALTLNDELIKRGNGITERLAATFGTKKTTATPSANS